MFDIALIIVYIIRKLRRGISCIAGLHEWGLYQSREPHRTLQFFSLGDSLITGFIKVYPYRKMGWPWDSEREFSLTSPKRRKFTEIFTETTDVHCFWFTTEFQENLTKFVVPQFLNFEFRVWFDTGVKSHVRVKSWGLVKKLISFLQEWLGNCKHHTYSIESPILIQFIFIFENEPPP